MIIKTTSLCSPHPWVLIIHGFTEYGARYSDMVTALKKYKIEAETIDLCGHGSRRDELPTDGDWFNQFSLDIEHRLKMVSNQCVPKFLFGHSMGGTAVLHYLRQKSYRQLSGIIVSSPCCGPSSKLQSFVFPILSFFAQYFPNLLFPSRNRASILTADLSKQNAYLKDSKILSFSPVSLFAAILSTGQSLTDWQPDEFPPFLVHQGEADRLCHPETLYKWFARWPNGSHQLQCWPKGQHELPNEIFRAEYYQFIANWIWSIVLNSCNEKP